MYSNSINILTSLYKREELQSTFKFVHVLKERKKNDLDHSSQMNRLL